LDLIDYSGQAFRPENLWHILGLKTAADVFLAQAVAGEAGLVDF